MKYITLLFILISTLSFSQIPQDFEIELEPITIANAPGVHSFSVGVDSLGRWLVLGGRVDGLHHDNLLPHFWPMITIQMHLLLILKTDKFGAHL